MKDDRSAIRKTSNGHALLVQHRALPSSIVHVEGLASRTRASVSDASRSELAGLLRALIRSLELHFDAERKSLANDFEDVPDLRAALVELDEDHPRQLQGFTRALEVLQRGAAWEQVCSLVAGAISAFRDHEASEDTLFAALS